MDFWKPLKLGTKKIRRFLWMIFVPNCLNCYIHDIKLTAKLRQLSGSIPGRLHQWNIWTTGRNWNNHEPTLVQRWEKYAMIYVWKILQGLTPNFGIESYNIPQTGCNYTSKYLSYPAEWGPCTAVVLSFNGPQLFDASPKYLRKLLRVGGNVFQKPIWCPDVQASR